MSKIAIGIRCFGNADSMFMKSLIDFLAANKTTDTMLLPIVYDLPYHVAASEIVHKFIASNYDNLLFIDSDMVFTYADFLAIKKDIEDPINKDFGIIGGLYPTRRGCIHPIAMYKDGENWKYETTNLKDGVNIVDGLGLGFTIIKRECFFMPCFKDNKNYFTMEDGTGEDVSFCQKVIKGGYKVGLDKNINLGHRGTFTIKWNCKDNKAEIISTDCFGQ